MKGRYMGEVWKDIPGWEGFYQASSEGRIRSIPRDCWKPGKTGVMTRHRMSGRVLRAANGAKGYKAVVLSDLRNGRRPAMFRVHRLICLTFHGPPYGERDEVAHRDGTRDNNRSPNLRWATRAENFADLKRHRAERLAIGG